MFPNGWPGRGLLLLRASVGMLVIRQVFAQSPGPEHSASMTLVASGIAGLLVLLGIWTPVTGLLLAALEILRLWHWPGAPEAGVLTAAVALAIAMLGPGVWSVDAALFGRRRLELPEG